MGCLVLLRAEWPGSKSQCPRNWQCHFGPTLLVKQPLGPNSRGRRVDVISAF